MSNPLEKDHVLVERTAAGDREALAALFDRYRSRLRQMVRLRLDRRLQGRVDPSDVLQEAFVDMANELPAYARKRSIPLFLWMRLVTGQRLMCVHRHHLGAEMRDASRDVSLWRIRVPPATSASLAAQLLGRGTTPGHAAIRAEVQAQLQTAIECMSEIDREIIALRNFEELDNSEAAMVLGIAPATAAKRYVRALTRLQDILRQMPGVVEVPE